MSAKETGPAGEAAVMAGSSDAVTDDRPGSRDDAGSGLDPWFGAGAKISEPADGAAAGTAGPPAAGPPAASPPAASTGAASTGAADWFLPTGRAALQPEAMTDTWDEEEDAGGRPGRGREGRPGGPALAAPAGAPPWAGEPAVHEVSAPPPWESGPWSGPGQPWSAPASAPAGPAAPGDGKQAASGPQAGGPSSRAILLAGAIPLVLPGLVAGLLGLRAGLAGHRRASWLAIAMSLAWAVVLVVVVVSLSGRQAASCTYPAAVRQSYTRVMADLSGRAPAAVEAADLGQAVTQANAAAAAAGQLGTRDALSALAADLQQARTDVTANQAVPITLRQHLAADGPALAASCPAG